MPKPYFFVFRYPRKIVKKDTGETLDAQKVAEEIINKLDIGGFLVLPNDRDSYGDFEWDIKVIEPKHE